MSQGEGYEDAEVAASHGLALASVILIAVQIQLLYFGVLKDLFGCDRESLELADGARVEDAIRFLRSRASNRQEQLWSTMAIAVNLEYAGVSTLLNDADEVALLPPVSGGGWGLDR